MRATKDLTYAVYGPYQVLRRLPRTSTTTLLEVACLHCGDTREMPLSNLKRWVDKTTCKACDTKSAKPHLAWQLAQGDSLVTMEAEDLPSLLNLLPATAQTAFLTGALVIYQGYGPNARVKPPTQCNPPPTHKHWVVSEQAAQLYFINPDETTITSTAQLNVPKDLADFIDSNAENPTLDWQTLPTGDGRYYVTPTLNGSYL